MDALARESPATMPSWIDVGISSVGAKIEGDFRVWPAREVLDVSVQSSTSQEGRLICFGNPKSIPGRGCSVPFTVCTEHPCSVRLSIVARCDTGTVRIPFRLQLRPEAETCGEIAVCSSPVNGYIDGVSLSSLTQVLSTSKMRIHYINDLSLLPVIRPRLVMLHGYALVACTIEEVTEMHRMIEKGGNVGVFADRFIKGTTEAANRLTERYGVEMLAPGLDDPGLSDQEKVTRVVWWRKNYDERMSEPQDIIPHELTRSVKRIFWQRPSPILSKNRSVTILVRNSEKESEGFLALCRPRGLMLVLATSSPIHFCSKGYPFNNQKLISNIASFMGRCGGTATFEGCSSPELGN